eukprot:4988287-Heterocapsa_arctica.AAC.1
MDKVKKHFQDKDVYPVNKHYPLVSTKKTSSSNKVDTHQPTPTLSSSTSGYAVNIFSVALDK